MRFIVCVLVGIHSLVCNTHPERRTGEIVLPGAWTKSKTLLGGGATFRKDRLVLDMKPIDTVLIRLDRQISGVE